VCSLPGDFRRFFAAGSVFDDPGPELYAVLFVACLVETFVAVLLRGVVASARASPSSPGRGARLTLTVVGGPAILLASSWARR